MTPIPIVIVVVICSLIVTTTATLMRTPSTKLRQCSTPLVKNPAVIQHLLNEKYGPPHCTCADSGNWRRLVYLNMTDNSQQCPSSWTLLSDNTYRGCGKSSSQPGCDSAIFPSNGIRYNKVCGRVIGYQKGSTDAFDFSLSPANTIEEEYVDGVSLTHGLPGARRHIWTFVSAVYEQDPNC